MDLYLFQGHRHKVKHKWLSPGFELRLWPFAMALTIVLRLNIVLT